MTMAKFRLFKGRLAESLETTVEINSLVEIIVAYPDDILLILYTDLKCEYCCFDDRGLGRYLYCYW